MTITISKKMLTLMGCMIGIILVITIAYRGSKLFAQEQELAQEPETILERFLKSPESKEIWDGKLRPRLEYIREKHPVDLVIKYLDDPENTEAQRDIIVLLLLDYFGRHIEEPGMWSTFADLDTRRDRIWIDRRTREKYEEIRRLEEEMKKKEKSK